MKKKIVFLVLILGAINLKAQNENSATKEDPIIIRCGATLIEDKEPLYVVDGVPWSNKEALKDINLDDIVSINVLKNTEVAFGCYGRAGKNGVVIIQTKRSKSEKCKVKTYPFKVYCIPNTNWVLQPDIYNALEAGVPSLRVQNKNLLSGIPSIRLRGTNVDEVIVDGVRYNISILNSLNPNDIESIRVVPSVAATSYFANMNAFN
ncbi:TonB-dependent receptor plug domain-containing protein [Flagellimonas sp. 2504JD4-2]